MASRERVDERLGSGCQCCCDAVCEQGHDACSDAYAEEHESGE